MKMSLRARLTSVFAVLFLAVGAFLLLAMLRGSRLYFEEVHYRLNREVAAHVAKSLAPFDGEELVYTSNRTGETYTLDAGIYALTNTRLGDEWPKAVRGRAALEHAAHGDVDQLLAVLRDETIPPDHELPQRGRDIEVERRAAACFIRGEQYGTRASTAVIFEGDGVAFAEQLYGPMGSTGDRASMARKLDCAGKACRTRSARWSTWN